MKYSFLLLLALSLCLFSCGDDDPCETDPQSLECPTGDADADGVLNSDDTAPSDACDPDPNALECPTGDTDGDGVINSEDSDPSDACVPNTPPFEQNVIGTWTYSAGLGGRVIINADGTYEEPEGELISSGPINSRTWRIENDRMVFDVETASLSLAWKEYDCDSMTFDGEGFIPDLVFTRA